MPDRTTPAGSPHPPSTSDWSDALRVRLAPLALTPAREREIADELSQHLDDRYEALRAEGVAEAEARRLALEELADHDTLAAHMRALRQAHTLPPIPAGAPRRRRVADFFQDVRYAARMLRRQPGFTIAAVLTLALGIGANTAVFSLVNATLFQPLRVGDPASLAYVARGNGGVFSYPMYATLRDHNQHFTGLAGWGGISASLNAGDSAELVNGLIVTGNFFDVLDVGPAARGRLLSPADDVTPGAHPVAVISYDFWQTRFAGEADVVGREVRLNGHVFTVVGVAPAGFDGPTIGSGRSIYVPMMMQAIMRPPRARYSGDQNPDLLKHVTNSWISAVGRLKPGARIEQARLQLESVASEFVRTQLPAGAAPAPAAPSGPLQPISVRGLEEGRDDQRRQLRSAALLLGGVVGAVLLIACANIANLLLSRASARRREVAVRLALGASRSRLVRQLLTESVLLSLIGGGAGVALAWAATAAFQAAPPPPGALPLALVFPIDQRVLLFSLLLSCATGILFGIAPALETSRPGLVPALKGSDAAAGERRARFDLKKVLVVGEVALSLLLLIAAGLFVRGLQAARDINPGVDVDKLVSAPLSINLLRYTRAQGREFYRQAVEQVERLPGVESATVARIPVLGGSSRVLSIHVEGRGSTHERAQSEGGRRRVPRSEVDQRQRGRPELLQDHRHLAGEGPRLPGHGRRNRTAGGHLERDRRGDAVRGRQSDRQPGQRRWAGRSVAGDRRRRARQQVRVAGGGSRAGGLPAARAESRNRHGPVRPRLGPAGLTRRQPAPRDSAARCQPACPQHSHHERCDRHVALRGAHGRVAAGGLRRPGTRAGGRGHLRRVVVLGVTAHPRDGHSTGARCGHAPGLHAGRPRWDAAGRRRNPARTGWRPRRRAGDRQLVSRRLGDRSSDLHSHHRPVGHGGAGRLRDPGAAGDPGQSDHGAPSRVRRAQKQRGSRIEM